MPNRILREGILTSPRIAKLGWAEEIFYRRLMSVVDDFGRYYADPGLLQAACYPRQLKKVSESDVLKWLQACCSALLVRVYQHKGESYLEMLDFGQQIRAKKSKFPDVPSTCVADAQQTHEDAHLDVSVSVVVSEDVSVSVGSAKPKAKPSKKCPDDFEVTPDMKDKARQEAPSIDMERETLKFRNHEFAKAKSDWPATWLNWMMTAEDNFRKSGNRQMSFAEENRQRVLAAAPSIASQQPRQTPVQFFMEVEARDVTPKKLG